MPMKKNVANSSSAHLAACGVLLSILGACTPGHAIRSAPAWVERTVEQAQRIAYVDQAMQVVREHALFADRVDWQSAERRLHDAAMTKSSSYALYVDLEWLLQQLSDNHSFLQLNDAAEQGYRTQMGLAFKSSGAHPTVATRFRQPRALEAIDQGRLRLVTVPSMMGDQAAQTLYAEKLAGMLSHRPLPCGIVLDFRGNGGGNMWPMLSGLSPLVSTANLGAFVEPSARMEIAMRSGALLVSKDGKDQQVISLDGWRHDPILQSLPVAILVDGATGSSGEIVPILLSARPRVRTFGQATYGASTSTEGFPLSDGANLVIVTSGVADAGGTLHLQGLTPDRAVDFMPDADSVSDPDVAAAKAWFSEMQCR